MQDNEQELTRNFFRRVFNPEEPRGFLEGALKGVMSAVPVGGLLMLPPERLVLLLLSAALLGGGWGGLRERRGRNQLTFWERAISPMPPATKGEGLVKGFSAAFIFSAFILLYSKFKFKPEYLPIAFLTCVGISVLASAGLAWGHHNEMQNARPR